MLIYYFTDIDFPFGAAEPRLLGALPELDVLAEGAYRDGEARRARLGVEVARVQVPAFVRLAVGMPAKGPGRLTIPLSWTAEGPSALFPEMDADLMLATLGPDASQLSLRGSYTPPMGAVGRALDRMLMHRVAESSVKGFVDRIAESINAGVMRAG
ncbi:MAG TPA: hypothetical protein VHM94_09965 [Acidimicrobiia bacterium]|nr:hypothetical protein [Acidimicrobiia bacterium]